MMKRAQGYTIVELMVALTLGMMVTAGVAAVLVSSSTIFRSADLRAQIQSGSRFALGLMEEDVRLAGYLGCYNKHLFSGLRNLVDDSATTFNYNYAVPVGGFEAHGGEWLPKIEASIGQMGDHEPIKGTDVLVVRGPIGASVALAEDMTSLNSPLVVNATDKLENGSLAVVSDCNVADVFRVTGTPAAKKVLHNDSLNTVSDLSKKYLAGRNTQITPLGTISYFVAAGSAGNGARSLWRQVNGDTPEEAVEGVHDFQAEYGVDRNGDLAADQFVLANALQANSAVVAVRLSLLLRSQSDKAVAAPMTYNFNGASTKATDRHLYTPFTTSIQVRNQVK